MFGARPTTNLGRFGSREEAACRGMTPRRHAYSPATHALALDAAARAERLDGLAFGVRGTGREP